MAEQLKLKVSEERVREAIDTVTTHVAKMEEHLAQFEAVGERLKRHFFSVKAKIAYEVVEQHAKNVRKKINDLNNQKEALIRYLDLMSTTDSQVSSNLENALEAAKSLFD